MRTFTIYLDCGYETIQASSVDEALEYTKALAKKKRCYARLYNSFGDFLGGYQGQLL